MPAFVALNGVSHEYAARGGAPGGTLAVDGLTISIGAGALAVAGGLTLLLLPPKSAPKPAAEATATVEVLPVVGGAMQGIGVRGAF